MNREYLKPIPPIKANVNSVLDKLSVEVDYEKGGWNCFTGDINERGIYVHVTPTRIEEHEFNGKTYYSRVTTITGDMSVSGFKVFIKPLNRRSDKQLDIIYNKVGEIIDNVVNEFVNGNYQKVAQMLKSC